MAHFGNTLESELNSVNLKTAEATARRRQQILDSWLDDAKNEMGASDEELEELQRPQGPSRRYKK